MRGRLGPASIAPPPADQAHKSSVLSPDLSQTELALTQAYYALRWQAGPAGAAPLSQEDLDFENQTVQQCRVPRNGQLPPDAAGIAACMQRAYEHQRANWMSRLTGPAAEEAARRLEDHVALQRKLQLSGFLPSTETIDGVYGATTRTAISAWQRANNRPDTSFLSNADAAILLAGQQPAASPARQASPAYSPIVGSACYARRPLEPSESGYWW